MSLQINDDVAAKVLRQVEYYFSDSNLPTDQFLLKSIQESDDGLVSLPLICSFQRMRGHLGLTEAGPDKVPPEVVSSVVKILEKSSSLKLSPDGLRVGRVSKLLKPEEVKEEVNLRSIAAGPFQYKITQEEVATLFGQYGTVNSVKLPRHPESKVFCGSAIIEFSSKEEAEKALQMSIHFQGIDLELIAKKTFDERVEKDNLSKPRISKDSWNRGHFSNQGTNFVEGVIVAFKITRRDGTAIGDKDSQAQPDQTVNKVQNNGSDEHVESDKPKLASEENLLAREDIKDTFQKYGTVKFIDYAKGDSSGYLRFEQSEDADKARTAAVLAEEGGIVIKDYMLTLEAVQGDDEVEYWNKLREGQNKRRAAGDTRGRGRGRGRHGDRSFSSKKHSRSQDDSSVEPESKLTKTD